MYKLAFALPIGKLYIKGIKNVTSSLNSQRTIESLSSQLFEQAIKPLQITLFPEDSASNNLDDMYCWIMIKCACCKKNIYMLKKVGMNTSMNL